ncbi:plant/protein [Wolffia australiana]
MAMEAVAAIARLPSQKKTVIVNLRPGSRPTSAAGFGYSLSSPLFLRGRRREREAPCASAGREDDEEGSGDLERALGMDGGIPRTSEEFLRRVSSRAYGMRRNLQQNLDSISYDVLDSNPWRGNPKAVYVLTQRENQLWTMKTRTNRSEVEQELNLLFSRGGTRQSNAGNKSKNSSRSGIKFRMLVEDIRDGVLVFEDEQDAAKYCDLLEGGGQGCEGVAELEASSVFEICQKMKALAVLFRRGGTPPLPEKLQLNLRARKRSLEDQEEA